MRKFLRLIERLIMPRRDEILHGGPLNQWGWCGIDDKLWMRRLKADGEWEYRLPTEAEIAKYRDHVEAHAW